MFSIAYTKSFEVKHQFETDPEIYQILTWSTTCCMWRVEKVSRLEKKTYLFAECKKNTRQNYFFAEC